MVASRIALISEVIMGHSPPGYSYNNNGIGVPLINGPTEFTKRNPIKKQWTTEPTRYCEPGDVLVCVRGSSTGRINIANDRYCIGRGVCAIRERCNSVNVFLESAVTEIVERILLLSAGSTFPSIDGSSIRGIQFWLPSKSEQIAIGEVLSDMDAEIGALEARLAKARLIKLGMMQELLTGRIRLV